MCEAHSDPWQYTISPAEFINTPGIVYPKVGEVICMHTNAGPRFILSPAFVEIPLSYASAAVTLVILSP